MSHFCSRIMRRGWPHQVGGMTYDKAKELCHARMPDSDTDEATLIAVARFKARSVAK